MFWLHLTINSVHEEIATNDKSSGIAGERGLEIVPEDLLPPVNYDPGLLSFLSFCAGVVQSTFPLAQMLWLKHSEAR